MTLSGGLNIYGYVNANLLKLIDPRGLDSCSPFLNLGFPEIQKCTRTPPANPLPISPPALVPFPQSKSIEQCESDEWSRCKQVCTNCAAQCSDRHTPDFHDLQSMNFQKCYSQCLTKNNCLGVK